MSSNKKNRILVLVFLALAAAILLYQYGGWGSKERSFDKELVTLHPDDIDQLLISGPEGEVTLLKQDDGWTVGSGERTYVADTAMVKGILSELSVLESVRIAAVDEGRWGEYQVDDSMGVRLRMMEGNEVLADLIVGSYTFNQRTRGANSYVRLQGKPEVHVVDGLLRMLLTPEPGNFRSKALTNFSPEQVESVSLTAVPADSSFILEREGGIWTVNGMAADSARVEEYLRQLASLRSNAFTAEDKGMLGIPSNRLSITLRDMEPVELELYRPDSLSVRITSSMHPDGVFDGSSGDLQARMGRGPQGLLP